MKNQLQLLTPSINLTATVAVTHQEAQVNIGARSLSWYHAAVRPGPVFASELAAFAGDIARAVSDETVQALIDALDPDLPACVTLEVAEEEVKRAGEALFEAAAHAHPRSVRLFGAALTYAAASLRRRAVRW